MLAYATPSSTAVSVVWDMPTYGTPTSTAASVLRDCANLPHSCLFLYTSSCSLGPVRQKILLAYKCKWVLAEMINEHIMRIAYLSYVDEHRLPPPNTLISRI